MGRTSMKRKQATGLRDTLRFMMGAALLTAAASGLRAQTTVVPPGGIGTFNPGTGGALGDDQFTTIGNTELFLTLGAGKNQGGSIGLFTTTTNATDPSVAFYNPILFYGPLVKAANQTRLLGTRVFVRVDGGINGGSGGFDYELGQPDITKGGAWLLIPSIIGNRIVASWTTYPIVNTFQNGAAGGTGTGGGAGGTGGGTTTTTGLTVNPNIEIDMTLSLVHNQARFQFNIVNNDTGRAHTVGLVFKQEELVNLNDGTISAPLRIPNRPYLRTEQQLAGGDIPTYYESLFPGTPSPTGPPNPVHSVRGTLRPTATSGNEPTLPSRFVLGRSNYLEGDIPPASNLTSGGGFANVYTPGPSGRYFDTIWSFVPNPTIRFDTPGSQFGSVALYYDEQPIAPGQTIPIIAYVGQSQTSVDLGTPISLVVTSPDVLNFNATTFPVNAYVTNLLDLQQGGGIAVSPVNLSIDLPAGLTLAPGDTVTKTIPTIAAGTEGSASWNVVADGTRVGNLTYTVTASANLGTGKVVQRSIYVPTNPAVDLRGNAVAKGLFQMVSFPLDFQGDPLTTVLFPGQDKNLVTPDVARYDPVTGKYETVTTFQLGQAYWIRSRLAADTHVVLPSKYLPLANQVQPSASAYRANYTQGWNQIGNPYLYPINFSEVEIFNPTTLAIVPIAEASTSTNQLVSPAVYEYDTSDPSPANWHYVLEPSIGFQMQPFAGYWVFVNQPNLQFLYPGVDEPGVIASRAAVMGVGFSKRLKSVTQPEVLGKGTSDNWRLKVSARSASGYDPDTFIGVAPKATDGNDVYKYSKPPQMNKTLTMDIVHDDWVKGGRYAHDLRSAILTAKTWNMVVHSDKPNESVTVTWPGISRDVPRNYRLTLIDPQTNQQVNMRNSPSHVVSTGIDATRSLQIVAEPVSHHDAVQITEFEVLNNGVSSRAVAGASAQSANIRYSVSGDAEAQIVIRNPRGQVIRTLSNVTSRAVGGVSTGTALWDLKTQQGVTVATGQYQIELNVKTATGRSARRVTPFMITR